jgi:hypothetical protein
MDNKYKAGWGWLNKFDFGKWVWCREERGNTVPLNI